MAILRRQRDWLRARELLAPRVLQHRRLCVGVELAAVPPDVLHFELHGGHDGDSQNQLDAAQTGFAVFVQELERQSDGISAKSNTWVQVHGASASNVAQAAHLVNDLVPVHVRLILWDLFAKVVIMLYRPLCICTAAPTHRNVCSCCGLAALQTSPSFDAEPSEDRHTGVEH
jgi:hypothetical protein